MVDMFFEIMAHGSLDKGTACQF